MLMLYSVWSYWCQHVYTILLLVWSLCTMYCLAGMLACTVWSCLQNWCRCFYNSTAFVHYWHKLAGVSVCTPYLVWLCLLLCCFKHECLQLSMLLLHWVNLLAYFPLQLQSWAARHFSSRHKMWSCCWTCGRAVVLHFYLHHITIFEVKLVCHQHPRALKFATTDSAQWCLIWSFIML